MGYCQMGIMDPEQSKSLVIRTEYEPKETLSSWLDSFFVPVDNLVPKPQRLLYSAVKL